MQPALQHYFSNKIISLSVMVAVLILTWLVYGFSEAQWQLILVLLISFGYTHFLVGWFYQGRSLLKQSNVRLQIVTFVLLAIGSIVLTEVFFELLGYATTLFLGFLYFLLHGLFNEQTLIKREGGVLVPLLPIFSLAVFIFALLAYSVPDQTFLFNRQLAFAPVNDFELVYIFSRLGLTVGVFPYIFWGGIVLSFVTLLISWCLYRNTKLSIGFGLGFLLATVCVRIWDAPPYIFLYFLVVGYHFMTWFLFFVRTMSGRSRNALVEFLTLHLIVALPFLIWGWFFFTTNSPVSHVLFDYKYFVIATYVHISTSFMNDDWFKALQMRVFNFVLGRASQKIQ